MTTTMAADIERLGDVLIREGLLTRAKCDQALAEQRSSGHRLGYVLVKLGLVPEIEITKILARQHRMPAVDLSRFEVDPKILKLIPADLANKHVVLPLKREGRTLTVAMADPTNMGLLEDLKFITRYDVFPVLAGEYTLRSLHRAATTSQRPAASGHPEGHGGAGRGRRDRLGARGRGGHAGPDRRRAGGQADQRPPDRRGPAGRQRHPHRALRARAPGALPHRRRAARGHEAAAQDEGGAHLAHQDPVAAQHRRAAGAAGRPPQAQDGQPGHRLPRLDAAGAASARRSCSVFSTRAT